MNGSDNFSLSERIAAIRRTLPDSVRLIAVTKQVPVSLMRQAYAAGIRDFGESKVQSAIAKQDQLQDLSDITWHMIGHLQSNKAKLALQRFDWIHSVDSLKIARRLDSLAAELGCQPQVCLQVKILSDPNKYGWKETELIADLPQLDQCRNLRIKGLMTILPLALNSTEAANAFAQTRQLADVIRQKHWSHLAITQLSMGMSADYLLAVEAGATMVRIGQALFGKRPDSKQLQGN